MKILWFSNTPAIGVDYIASYSKLKGAGGWMYSLNKVVKDKVELSVVFHHPYPMDKFTYEKTNFYPVYTGNIIIENLKKRFLKTVYDQHFLNKYLSIINEVKPDLIHIHGTENAYLCILLKTKIPVIISIQGNLTVIKHKFKTGFNSKYLHFKSIKINAKSLVFGSQNFYRDYQNMKNMAQIEQANLKHARFVMGRTNWDRRITRVLAPDSKYYVGNEILRDNFYENQWFDNFSTGKLILFSTNGNIFYKGFETLCHTLNLLNNLGLEVEWRVAGVSNSSLINRITKKALNGDYPKKGLILLGTLDEKDLINNLKESNIFIMTSHIENSPNNLCEAMILGMPCIATYAGGTGSMLKDGDEGILIQDGDPWVMAGAIMELYRDKDKAIQYSIKARATALKRHNREEIVNNLIATYQQIINEASHYHP